MRTEAVIFDLDGVLLDSLPALERAYEAFASEQGFVPTHDEFERLNGPHLREIIAYLRRTHGLGPSEPQLLDSYLHQIERHREQTALMPDAHWLVEKLSSLSYRLAVASSAPRAWIERSLDRFGLREYFELIVSGDDVERAKPAPDIYQHAAALLPDVKRPIVVEDSTQGVAAALDAGLRVVLVHPLGTVAGPRERTRPLAGQACGLREVLPCVAAASEDAVWLASACRVQLRVVPEPLQLEPQLEASIAALWHEKIAQRPELRDGQLLSYVGHRLDGDLLRIDACAARFRHFVAALEHPEWGVPIAPLGVSGAACDPRGRVLCAERAQVTQYVGCVELVPSGGIDERHQQGEVADPVAQLREEWEEESGLPSAMIANIRALGLVRAPDGFVHDLCYQIELASPLELEQLRLSPEYIRPQVGLPLELRGSAEEAPLVPITRALLAIIA